MPGVELFRFRHNSAGGKLAMLRLGLDMCENHPVQSMQRLQAPYEPISAGTDIMSRPLARFHFIAGLPRSGISVLTALLRQNPRFVAQNNSPSQDLFADLFERYWEQPQYSELLSDAQRLALLRAGFEAVYHDRPLDSVVFDSNRNWLNHIDELVQIFPLSRFIICVRNPASIVNSVALADPSVNSEADMARIADDLVDSDGAIGLELGHLRDALSGQHGERIFVLDYDRLADDPEEAMDVLYNFLREPDFTHDYDEIGDENQIGVSGPVARSLGGMILPTRLILQLSGRAFWRNLKRTSATLMLGRAR